MKIFDFGIFIFFLGIGLWLFKILNASSHEYNRFFETIINISPLANSLAYSVCFSRVRQMFNGTNKYPQDAESFSQLGMAACSTIVFISSVYIPIRFFGLLSIGGEFKGVDFSYWLPPLFREHLPVNGLAVLAVWTNLVMSRRWTFSNNLFSYLGILLGIYFIAVSIYASF